MEPRKLVGAGNARPVRTGAAPASGRRPRPHRHALAACGRLTCALLLTACTGDAPVRPGAAPATGGGEAAVPAPAAQAPAATPVLEPLRVSDFRPVVFEDAGTLWGIRRGRLARLDIADQELDVQPHAAWSVTGAPGVVSWRNESGTWGWRRGDSPRRLAPTELLPGYDGPPDVLWSPDGSRALLLWTAEWDVHHEVLEADGSRSAVANTLEDYMLDRAVLWLDERRVLFQVVASAPKGGEPEYRESGWRGDLAVLDLETGEYRRITDADDGTHLRVAGLFEGEVLVRADRTDTAQAHWLYQPGDWSRAPIDVPGGRTFAASDVVVGLTPVPEAGEDRWNAWLFAGGKTTALGVAADPDLPPAIRPDGRLVALRVLRDGRPTLLLIRR